VVVSFAPLFLLRSRRSAVRWALRIALPIALACATSGCATYIGHAKRSYAEGRYLETEERLSNHEIDVPYLASDNQCLYGMYRGMALMALGDVAGAERWLAFAYDVERQNSGALKPEERAMLDRAWFLLFQSRGITRAPAPSAP
jgi:hypothetical protein